MIDHDDFLGVLQAKSSLERKLLLAGLLDVKSSEAGQSIGVSVLVLFRFMLFPPFVLSIFSPLPATSLQNDSGAQRLCLQAFCLLPCKLCI